MVPSGNVTRGDCTECGYGTAPISVVRNAEPPRVAFEDPVADNAEGELTLTGTGVDQNGDGQPDDLPQYGDTFELTDADGTTVPFVFDDTTGTANGTLKAPEAKIEVSGHPGDGQTFEITDHRDNTTKFVFDASTDVADGSTVNIAGIPHVVVGTRDVNGNAEEMSNRLTSAINGANNLDVTAVVDAGADVTQGTVTVTQNSTEFSGNTPIDLSEVNNMETDGFRGGVVVGIQGMAGNPNGIAARIASAVNGARGSQGLNIEAEVSTDDGVSVKLKQRADGFGGNTEINTDEVNGVDSEPFIGGRPNGWVVTPGQEIQLDFTPSRDPEGVMGQELETSGIFYRYSLPNGGGVIRPSPGYEDRANGNDGRLLQVSGRTGDQSLS